MPPAFSEDDSDSDQGDIIPSKPQPKTSRRAGKQKAEEPEEPEEPEEQVKSEDEADDDEEDGEEFAVEKIVSHVWEKSKCLYEVKWVGYEERTFEPEENLASGAAEVLAAYHKTIGGRPTKTVGRKRKSVATAAEDSEQATPARGRPPKKQKSNGAWEPPKGDWETAVESIETIGDDNSAADGPKLYVFLIFEGGEKKKFPMSMVRKKCPQKLLDYYEKHLVFKDSGVTADEVAEDD